MSLVSAPKWMGLTKTGRDHRSTVQSKCWNFLEDLNIQKPTHVYIVIELIYCIYNVQNGLFTLLKGFCVFMLNCNCKTF